MARKKNLIAIFLVCLGERQKLSVKIDSRSYPAKDGILLLESQTEGMEIIRVSKVSACLTRPPEVQDTEELELDMSDSGEISLPNLDAQDKLELFVEYEGPYTEFDYRVKRNTETLHQSNTKL